MTKNFFVTNKEVEEISQLVKNHGHKDLAERIYCYQDKARGFVSASSISLLNTQILTNAKLQDDLYKLFKDSNNFNLASFYEKQLLNHSWQNDLFTAYTRFIKLGVYYPENDKVIYDSINGQSMSSIKTFWAMVSLVSLVKDDETSLNCFHLILKEKKKGDIPLLDLERVKRSLDKRFKGIDVSTLPQKEYNYLVNLFSSIETSKEKSFFNVSDGHYIKINVDFDLISQENKLSKAKNMDALRAFLVAFERFSKKSQELRDVLSVDEFKQDVANCNMTFYYSDPCKKDMIKSLACDLVDYATSKFETNKLKGYYINSQDSDKFFSSYVMNYVLQHTLKKDEQSKPKKVKI